MTGNPYWDFEILTVPAEDRYVDKLNHVNDMIRLALVVPEMASSNSPDTGTYNLGETQIELFLANVESILDQLRDVINRQLMREIVTLNFGPSAPDCDLIFEPVDAKVKQTMLAALLQMIGGGSPIYDADGNQWDADWPKIAEDCGVPLKVVPLQQQAAMMRNQLIQQMAAMGGSAPADDSDKAEETTSGSDAGPDPSMTQGRAAKLMARLAEWREEEHPRDRIGRFRHKYGGGGDGGRYANVGSIGSSDADSNSIEFRKGYDRTVRFIHETAKGIGAGDHDSLYDTQAVKKELDAAFHEARTIRDSLPKGSDEYNTVAGAVEALADLFGELVDDVPSPGAPIGKDDAYVSWEAVPGKGSGYIEQIQSAPYDVRAEYTRKVSDWIRKEPLFASLGVTIDDENVGPGIWKSEGADSPDSNPSHTFEMSGEIEDVQVAAAIIGRALDQDGVGIQHNYQALRSGEIAKANAHRIKFSREITNRDMLDLYDAIEKIDADVAGSWFPAPFDRDGTEFAFVKWNDDIDNERFYEALTSALASTGLDEVLTPRGVYSVTTDLIPKPWEGETYETYIRTTNSGPERKDVGGATGGRPRVSRKALQRFDAGIRAIQAQFAKRYGWENSRRKANFREQWRASLALADYRDVPIGAARPTSISEKYLLWDEAKHPRYPEGDSQGRGGQFAPKSTARHGAETADSRAHHEGYQEGVAFAVGQLKSMRERGDDTRYMMNLRMRQAYAENAGKYNALMRDRAAASDSAAQQEIIDRVAGTMHALDEILTEAFRAEWVLERWQIFPTLGDIQQKQLPSFDDPELTRNEQLSIRSRAAQSMITSFNEVSVMASPIYEAMATLAMPGNHDIDKRQAAAELIGMFGYAPPDESVGQEVMQKFDELVTEYIDDPEGAITEVRNWRARIRNSVVEYDPGLLTGYAMLSYMSNADTVEAHILRKSDEVYDHIDNSSPEEAKYAYDEVMDSNVLGNPRAQDMCDSLRYEIDNYHPEVLEDPEEEEDEYGEDEEYNYRRPEAEDGLPYEELFFTGSDDRNYNVERVDTERVAKISKDMFGRELSVAEWCEMAAVPINARVSIYEGNFGGQGMVTVSATDPTGWRSERAFYRDRDGVLTTVHQKLTAEKDYKGTGARAVMHALVKQKELGIARVSVGAAGAGTENRNYENDTYNGYYTWARMGFDDTELTGDVIEALDTHYPGLSSKVRTIGELMVHPDGQDAWKLCGESFTGKINLTDDSPGWKVLQKYAKEKFGLVI